MANTFTKIASVTVGSGGASTMAFSSIPATYTDLQLLITSQTTSNNYIKININSDTGSNYTYKVIRGSGSAAGGVNTGGGSGGAQSVGSPAGGSGIVIIRYAGAQRGTGGTVTSSGGYTLHTFTSSGTYTA